jgi:limonene-1,2-epoxide hydrolase
MAGLELWAYCRAMRQTPWQATHDPMLGFNLTVMRAAAKARGVVLERVMAKAQSTEQAMVLLLRMGMEL